MVTDWNELCATFFVLANSRGKSLFSGGSHKFLLLEVSRLHSRDIRLGCRFGIRSAHASHRRPGDLGMARFC